MNYLKTSACFILLGGSSLSHANFSLPEATIHSIHEAIQKDNYSCQQITQLYLDRIKQSNFAINNAQPPLNAFVSINPNILQQAKKVDEFYQQNKKLMGPLHCIPIVVKDNIDTYDSPSTSGTYALLGSQPIKDAFMVKKMREAGAVMVGKTTMDEIASGFWGISSRSGRTGNAYNTARNPGGSSSGSAVAVSANFAVIGIGTDNSGSIRIPAAYNGLYSLRPSTGLISQQGIFPRGNMDGVAGPMARTIKDLAIALEVMAQPDPNDPKSTAVPREKSYLPNEMLSLNGVSIGVLKKVNGVDQFRTADPSVMQIYQNSIQALEKLGAKIVDNVELSNYDMDRKLNRVGEKEEIDAYLKNFPSTRKNYADICESGRLVFEGGITGCLKDITSLPPKNSKKYQQVLAKFERNKNLVHQLMMSNHVDLLITPIDAKGIAALGWDKGDTLNGVVASNAGLPGLTIVAGLDQTSQMPVGLELIGKQYDEKRLLQVAYVYEQQHSRPLPVIPSEESHLQLDIPQINNVITVFGERSYEQYLKNNNKEALTAENFYEIANGPPSPLLDLK